MLHYNLGFSTRLYVQSYNFALDSLSLCNISSGAFSAAVSSSCLAFTVLL